MRRGFHLTDAFLKSWLIGLIIVALSCGAFLQVYANTLAAPASMPTIQVTGVVPKGYVQLLISNLPANIEFAVTMGPVGSQGMGGLVAHFVSPVNGGAGLYWFEVENLVRSLATAEVRIDSGSGYVAWASFDNTTLLVPLTPTSGVLTPQTTEVAPAADKASPYTTKVQLVHVQKGGLVVVLVRDLPLNQEFTVTIGKGRSLGEGGYVIAHLPTADRTLNIAYFEIPVLLRNEASLDMRIEGAGALYLFNFANVDF
jgi:hypothetical protein